MLLPGTKREANMMGNAAGNLADKAREKTTEFIERATSTAKAITGGDSNSGSSSRRRSSGSSRSSGGGGGSSSSSSRKSARS
jgi:hypothetical protein